MSTLVLLRHGESISNQENRCTGWIDGPPKLAGFVGTLTLGVSLALIYRNNAKGRAAEGGGH